MKYEFYINNHNYKKGGIEDFIYSLKEIFKRNKLVLNVVKKISSDVDVLFVIENFLDNPKEILDFLEDSKSKSVQLFLIHSEFINEQLFFNTFSPKEIFFRKCIIVKILTYLYQLEKKDFRKIFLYLLFSFYVILGLFLGFKFLDIKKRVYFALRDYSLSKYIKRFNFNLALSDDVYNYLSQNKKIKNLLYLQNYFDISLIEKFKNKNLNNNLLYLTGYMTPHRKKIIKNQNRKNFNNFIVSQKLNFINYNFTKNKLIDFNLLFTNESSINKLIKIYKNELNVEINKFEIYISQRNNWPYLSTMRIIRAFRNQSIPINIGCYESSNYEILCINVISIDYFINNYSQIIENYFNTIEGNINRFNSDSDMYFNHFIKSIK